jgi:hypothetical protein
MNTYIVFFVKLMRLTWSTITFSLHDTFSFNGIFSFRARFAFLLGCCVSLFPATPFVYADGYEGSPLDTSNGGDASASAADSVVDGLKAALPEKGASDRQAKNTKSSSPSSYGATKEVRSPSLTLSDISQSRTSERSVSALAHYSRSRALLIAAIREFDQGLKFVSTEPLVNPHGWRKEVAALAHRLDKVLSPQARMSKSGTRLLEGSPSLLTETSE